MSLYHKIFMVTLIPMSLAVQSLQAIAEETVNFHKPTISKDLLHESQNSYIFVMHKKAANKNVVKEKAHRLTNSHGGQISHIYTNAIHGFSAQMSASAAKALAKNPNIKYYEQDAVVWTVKKPEGAPGNNKGDTTPPVPQVIPAGVERVGGPFDGTGYHAWIIDTGIDSSHADLNVGSGANFVTRGKDTTNDGNGHGTHVAGIIGAIYNDIDVVGVAQNATVHPVRVLGNNGSGLISGVVAGVDYVATNASVGDVANLSLGATGTFQSLEDAIISAANLGIKFAIAAGNDASDANNYSPAQVEHSNVFTVSAVDSSDSFAYFSNFGNPPIDFAAPGVDILSTKKDGGVISYSGTSMAAPHVAGILLIGNPQASGFALDDPDGNADPIAHIPVQ